MKKLIHTQGAQAILCSSLMLCATSALASGYHFGTQSVSSQSTANASSAEAADASTIFYNPAGISRLSGTNISVNANVVAPSVEYSGASATYYPVGPNAQQVSGKRSGNIATKAAVVPHLYVSHQINDTVTFGLGIYTPFASKTEYQNDSVLRYNVNKMGLTAIDINPTLGFKINDRHAVAVGVLGQYATAELRQYANFAPFGGLKNGTADGYADVEGSDWGFGYTLGYLWDVNDKVRLGASYRSKVDHTINGTAKWGLTSNAAALAPVIRGAGYVASEAASVKITTPESLSVHGQFTIDDKWTAFGDVTWTRHSRFNKAVVNYENKKAVANVEGLAPGPIVYSDKTVLTPQWKDTFKIGVGASYQYSKQLQLRFGVAYDQSPVRNADLRMSTLPDNDRIWLSLGAKYDFDENSSLNVGYSYVYIKDAKANVNGWCGGNSAATAKNCVSSQTNGSANFKSDAHILGVQYNHKF